MLQKCLTTTDLAAELGCSQQFVIDIENGKVITSLKTDFKIQNIFKIDNT